MMTNRASVLSKTKIVDLTRTVCASMPMFPGSEKPKLAAIASCSKDGFSETLLTLSSHTGTHMDAPAHVFAGRATLDALPAAMFTGRALVIDCSDLKEGSRVTMEQVARKGHLAEKADFLLFRTGWDKRWGKKSYFGDYPCIDEEVADFVSASRKKGLGVDVMGVDPISDENLTIHKRLFRERDLVVIENLCNLDEIDVGLVTICALPLKFKNSDGAPARVIAILDR
mgnify:CR=1 FL=1